MGVLSHIIRMKEVLFVEIQLFEGGVGRGGSPERFEHAKNMVLFPRFRGSKAEFSTFAAMKFRTSHALTESSLPSLPLPCAQERVFFKMLAAIPFGIAKAQQTTGSVSVWRSPRQSE